MKYSVLLLLLVSGGLFAEENTDSNIDNNQEIRNYCYSLVEDGTPAKEAEEQVSFCIEEQNDSAAEQSTDESQPTAAEEEPLDPATSACYDKVDAIIEKQMETNPHASDQYEDLLNDCLKTKMP